VVKKVGRAVVETPATVGRTVDKAKSLATSVVGTVQDAAGSAVGAYNKVVRYTEIHRQ
jgi:phage-related tail protein